MAPGHTGEQLRERAARILHIGPEQIDRLVIRRQSIDARKKPDIRFVYVVDVTLSGIREEKCVSRCKNNNISIITPGKYRFPSPGKRNLPKRPVIIGTGPAGLFCGYMLAMHGYRPILLERGKDVTARAVDVEKFWETGVLDPESNVAFGEGGAGTFSDGKLNTLVKDRDGRGQKVLSVFVKNGAQPEILYEAKPHIGTDVLTGVIQNMRKQIEKWGGEVRFCSRVDGLTQENGRLTGVILSDGSIIETQTAVLAIGHSARDTFEWLSKTGIGMQAKAFAVGLRVEHPQELINAAQYGMLQPEDLPPASYKVTAKTADERGVYSFCMCPGGYVVNASSEPGRLAVNGMSYSARDGKNANSAIIVSVTPEDYGADGPLAGIAFQRRLEEKAWQAGEGSIPVQRYGCVFLQATSGHIPDGFEPAIKGSWRFADVASILPPQIREAFVQGMEQFGRVIPGFNDKNTLLCGIESRTSSPVRIQRNEAFQSCIRGLYPCGEGAGYAGGITSAAMDGIRTAEIIAQEYAPLSDGVTQKRQMVNRENNV